MTVDTKREKLESSVVVAPEELPSDLLELLLDETERALLIVDARVDEPGHRVVDGDSPDDGELSETIREFRLAMAQTVDAHPGLQYEIERVNDRLRSLGALAASVEIAQHPHMLDLARLAVETFALAYPDFESFELAQIDDEEIEDCDRPLREAYESMSLLRAMLRCRMS